MTIHISLLGMNSNKVKRHAFRSQSKRIYIFFKNITESNIIDSGLHRGCSDFHPWCFVLPPLTPRSKDYIIGAFVIFNDPSGAYSFLVLYSSVSYGWLTKNLQSNYHIAFWLARILARLSKHEIYRQDFSSIQVWLRALKRSYSPLWESMVLNEKFKFKNRSTSLLSECAEFDYEQCIDSGVEIMPWTEWPCCVQSEDYAWFWRQSRYGRITDSQKVLLHSNHNS